MSTTSFPPRTPLLPTSHAPASRRPLIAPALIKTEVLRKLRNTRSLFINLVLPVALFLVVAVPLRNEQAGGHSVAWYLAVPLGVYAAMTANLTSGFSIALDRSSGWYRQLSLTPLRPAAFVVGKIVASMAWSALGAALVFIAPYVMGLSLNPGLAVASFAIVVVTSTVFAALGTFLGYLLPAQAGTQLIGLLSTALAFAGGLFYPLDAAPHWLQIAAQLTPAYGPAALARAPMTGDVDVLAIVNIVVWTVVLIAGSTAMMRRSTERV